MAHEHSNNDPQYEETQAPQNPPNAVLRPKARTGWLLSSLGTVILIFVVVAAAFLWVVVRHELGKDASISPNPRAVGTSGPELQERTPGGFDPAPTATRTSDELKYRGAIEPDNAQPQGLKAKELEKK